jgi:hypothetical protein
MKLLQIAKEYSFINEKMVETREDHNDQHIFK